MRADGTEEWTIRKRVIPMLPASWTDASLWLPLLGFLATSHAPEGKAEEVLLGGPRQAKAVVRVIASEYTITVTMLAVKTFDPATNAQLNRDKARSLAFRALARQLSDKPELHLVVSGSRVTKAELDGAVFTLTLRIPRRGVSVTPAGASGRQAVKTTSTGTAQHISISSALLTRKQDVLDTLERLVSESDRALKACRVTAAKQGREQAFYLAIADLEDRGQANLDKLSMEVNADKLLLTIEKMEILRSIHACKERMLASLREAAQDFERVMKKDKKP
jgi:hypothetical protein